MPFPLLAGVETSVTIAVDRLTFPLDMPPIILATTKIAKLPENTQSRYEIEIPIVVMIMRGFLPNLSLSPPTTGLARNCRKENREP